MQPAPLLSPFYEARGIIAQVWQRWFSLVSEHHRFVNREAPSAYDFTLANFTTNGTAQNLDLSAIITKGAVLSLLRVEVQDDAVDSLLLVRENSSAGTYNVQRIRTQVVNIFEYQNMFIALDNTRIINYIASNLTWTAINLTVGGWWI